MSTTSGALKNAPIKLKAEKREAGKGRKTGIVPAVVYGPKTPSTSISISEAELHKVWKAAGESTVIIIESAEGNHDVLIHDIARDPVSDAIIHVDFYAVDKTKKVHVAVPLEFIGVSPAVKNLGGTLIKVLHEIEVEALPQDLPHNIEVDISALETFESQIKASDLKLPAGVSIHGDADEIIALANPAKEEVEEESAPIDMDSIELSEKKGKKEDAEGEGESADAGESSDK